jgi:glycosyltransferase involved in cell wall biosynthesis
VIQEAMACGLPVVCGDLSAGADPGASRWLRGVEIVLSDPAGSALRCIAAMDSLADNPIDRIAMAKYAAETYSWPQMARAIVSSVSKAAELLPAATDVTSQGEIRSYSCSRHKTRGNPGANEPN